MTGRLVDVHDISGILCVASAGAAVVMGLTAGLVTLVSVVVSLPAVALLRSGVYVLGGLWLLVAALFLTLHVCCRYRLVARGIVR